MRSQEAVARNIPVGSLLLYCHSAQDAPDVLLAYCLRAGTRHRHKAQLDTGQSTRRAPQRASVDLRASVQTHLARPSTALQEPSTTLRQPWPGRPADLKTDANGRPPKPTHPHPPSPLSSKSCQLLRNGLPDVPQQLLLTAWGLVSHADASLLPRQPNTSIPLSKPGSCLAMFLVVAGAEPMAVET